MKNNSKQIDWFFEKLFDNKFFIWGLAIALFFSVNLLIFDILSEPTCLFWVKVVFSFLLIMALLFWRYRKHEIYYRRKFKSKTWTAFSIFCIIVFSFILQLFVSIPVNYFIKWKSKSSPIEYYECPVHYFRSNKSFSNARFKFKNEWESANINYKEYLPKWYEKDSLQNDYVLCIEVRKSIFGTYILEHKYLKRK